MSSLERLQLPATVPMGHSVQQKNSWGRCKSDWQGRSESAWHLFWQRRLDYAVVCTWSFSRRIHWKGKVWSIASFLLYPASHVSGRGPTGLPVWKSKLLLQDHRYILVYHDTMTDMITQVYYTTIYNLNNDVLTCTKHAKYIAVYTTKYFFSTSQYILVYTSIYQYIL